LRPWWSGEPKTTEPPPEQTEAADEALLEAVAKAVVERGLAAPAVFFLESSRPLSFVASQGLVLLGPFVDAALSVPNYEAFCRLMEDRGNVDKLMLRIEALDEERLARARRARAERRKSGDKTQDGPTTA
jgi:hypothetical protein